MRLSILFSLMAVLYFPMISNGALSLQERVKEICRNDLQVDSQSGSCLVRAYFSPLQGEKVFKTIYDLIKETKKELKIAIYSWSDPDLFKTLEELTFKNPKANIRIVLHPSLAKKERVIEWVSYLELLGIEFKWATQNMHEKFVLIDDQIIMNTSANFSKGAKSKYSENFIFHFNLPYKRYKKPFRKLFRFFKHEFAIIWNSGKDYFGEKGERKSKREPFDPYFKFQYPPETQTQKFAKFYSSSMNFTLKKNPSFKKNYPLGKYYRLSARKIHRKRTWEVRDQVIKSLSQSKDTIYGALNHFNLPQILDVLVNKLQSGVRVYLQVDNQEFKSSLKTKEMTPNFVYEWNQMAKEFEPLKKLRKDIGLNKLYNKYFQKKGPSPSLNKPINRLKKWGKTKKRTLKLLKYWTDVPPVRIKFYSIAPSPRYWKLNHHKFFLVDYNPRAKNTQLISGSYNFSRNAEHNQFDNVLIYKSNYFKTLFKDFNDEFFHLWNQNRSPGPKGRDSEPPTKVFDYFTKEVRGKGIPLHSNIPYSLSWDEATKIKNKVSKLANGIFFEIFKFRDCKWYSPKKREFSGCIKR